LERARSLLSADATLARATDSLGRSAFVLAHLHGHLPIAELLLAAGIELDLVEAVLAEDWERFEALAERRPDLLNAHHPIGGTPLHAMGLVGSHVGWRLRAQGCLPDARPEGGSGFTPARTALESHNLNWALIGLTDHCSNGSDVNARQRGGSSVLHGAVQRRSERLVRLAIRKGAEVEARDAEGRTPGDLAADLGWTEGVRLLAAHRGLPRDHRASRFARNASGEPIEFPDLSDVSRSTQSEVTRASHFNLARVRELIAKDPRLVFSLSTDDELPIEACAHTGARDIIRFYLDSGAPLSLPTAVSLGDVEQVTALLEADPLLVHERGAHDFPPLWYAAVGGGSAEMAELLMGLGVEVDQQSMGTTTLHWSARIGDLDLAAQLIEAGADLEAVGYLWDRDGQTPYQVAVAEDSPVAKLLREAGARG
jgi:ankyrin repeat protein